MLITVDQAKLQLRILDDDHDEQLEYLIPLASEIVLDFLKMEPSAWQTTSGDPDAVPGPVAAATALVVSALMENPEGAANGAQPLSQTVKDLLRRYRDPALA